MKNAVVFFADGFEEIEAITPVDYLRRAGINVTTVSVGTEKCFVNGAHKITIQTDMNLDSYLATIGNTLPDAVVVPGGMPGASNIADCSKVLSFLNVMNEEKKLVSAICASPAVVLGKTEILKDREWTCYPNMQNNAAQYESMYRDSAFVVSGNLITGRGPGAAEEFSMELVKYLCGQETYDKIKAGSCQR